MTASKPTACQSWPGCGSVAASLPSGPKKARASSDPPAAAANWTIQ